MEKRELPKNMVRKIINLREPGDINFLKQTLEKFGGRIIKELPLVDGYLCELPAEDHVLSAVRSEENRFQVEEDLEFKLCWLPWLPYFKPPFSPLYPPMNNPTFKPNPFPSNEKIGWGLKRIGANQVWNKLKNKRVRVGIIDTGIDYNHPDLLDNIKGGVCTIDGHERFMDDYGHGTHIAGIIGSSGKSFGMTGINPYVDIYAVKAFDRNGKGKLSDIIEGLDWLTRHQIDIINMSFSTTETNDTFYRVIQRINDRGIIMVAAAGNDGKRNSVNYPARFPQVLAVSATDKQDIIANFSSTGPEIDFCAPGVKIPSVWIGGRYEEKSGTSFAAPHITGIVADLLNYYDAIPSSRVKEIMVGGAVRLSTLNREQQGAGMVELPRIIR